MKKAARIPASWLYVAFGLAAHGVGLLLDPAVAQVALASFIDMTRTILPVLGLVFVLMYLAERFLTLDVDAAGLCLTECLFDLVGFDF